jgi:hypothetical protein
MFDFPDSVDLIGTNLPDDPYKEDEFIVYIPGTAMWNSMMEEASDSSSGGLFKLVNINKLSRNYKGNFYFTLGHRMTIEDALRSEYCFTLSITSLIGQLRATVTNNPFYNPDL